MHSFKEPVLSYTEYTPGLKAENKLVFVEYNDDYGSITIVAEYLQMRGGNGLSPISEAGGVESVQRMHRIRTTQIVTKDDFEFFQENGTIYFNTSLGNLIKAIKKNNVSIWIDPQQVEDSDPKPLSPFYFLYFGIVLGLILFAILKAVYR